MTHVKALQAGHSSQGTSEPITPVIYMIPIIYKHNLVNWHHTHDRRLYMNHQNEKVINLYYILIIVSGHSDCRCIAVPDNANGKSGDILKRALHLCIQLYQINTMASLHDAFDGTHMTYRIVQYLHDMFQFNLSSWSIIAYQPPRRAIKYLRLHTKCQLSIIVKTPLSLCHLFPYTRSRIWWYAYLWCIVFTLLLCTPQANQLVGARIIRHIRRATGLYRDESKA